MPGLFRSRLGPATAFRCSTETRSPRGYPPLHRFRRRRPLRGPGRSDARSLRTGVRVIDLLHEAPPFAVRASAHLLAALVRGLPRGHVFLGVSSTPGLAPIAKRSCCAPNGRWYVGPEQRGSSRSSRRAPPRSRFGAYRTSAGVSPSFHGRDVFAPMAAAVATDDFPNERRHGGGRPRGAFRRGRSRRGDLRRSLRELLQRHPGARRARTNRLVAGSRELAHARVFADAEPGSAFWYET